MVERASGASESLSRKTCNPGWLLKAGDVIEAEIEGIVVLKNGVVDESAA